MASRRIKILFLTKWYLHRNDPQFGVFIHKHAKAIAKFADVAVLHVMSDEKLSGSAFDEVIREESGLLTVQVYFKKSIGLCSGVINAYRYIGGTRKGLRIIRKKFGEYDLVHAYILLRPALVAWWLKVTSGKKYIISEQWSGYTTGKFSQRNFLTKALSRFVVSKAETVTTVSEFLKDSMRHCGLKSAYVVIPNIIEIPPVSSFEKEVNEKIKILVVADLVDEIKNISGTIRAFSEIFAQHKNAELNIIGHGRDEMKLKNLVAELRLNDAVLFHGVKPNEEVYRFLQRCDFLVMNSNFETFSLICAEALSCGKPLVATRCGGPQEFVTADTGILIEPGNHQQLVSAMNEMLLQYRSYSPEKLRHYAGQKFSAEIVGEKFFKVYTTITEIQPSY